MSPEPSASITTDAHILIHTAFEAQVARAGGATALTHLDGQLSYQQLNERANQVAHALMRLGVHPDDRVALCAARSPEQIIGMLGILKCGGAYVPIDLSHPAERVQFMLADSAPKAVLISRDQAELAGGFGLPTVDMEETNECSKATPRVAGLTPDSLAYVIYTSGSTGRPKGVMVEHRSVLELAADTTVPLGREDCVPHCASPSFDATTWEVWAPLLNGASVLIVPQCVLMNPAALNQLLTSHKVTAMWLTVGLFNEYVDALESGFGQLRHLIVGGDVLNPSIVARVLNKPVRPGRLLNGYGPTETTTFASMFVIEAAQDGCPLPIGRPIANKRLYILNDQLRQVANGETGEIYIGGHGVARGYFHHPGLTAERFIADAFGSAPGARLYKTGDLGRLRDDGVIEFLGRGDYQIKIRGFRVELGEIEKQLAGAPGVREALVIPREDTPGDRHLVAYLTTHQATTPAKLRTFLLQRLPEYMIPDAYVVLDRFPLNTNGKVDRGALPVPDDSARARRQFEAPRDEREQLLAQLWQEVLGVAQVGRRDNFFELGADSMRAMKLAARVSALFSIEFPFVAIFLYPDFLQMLSCIEQSIRERSMLFVDEYLHGHTRDTASS